MISSVSINRQEKLADEEAVTGRKCSELFLEILLWSFLLSSQWRDHPYVWNCSGKQLQHNLKHTNSFIGESFHIVRNIYFFPWKIPLTLKKYMIAKMGWQDKNLDKNNDTFTRKNTQIPLLLKIHLISSVLRHWCLLYIETLLLSVLHCVCKLLQWTLTLCVCCLFLWFIFFLL